MNIAVIGAGYVGLVTGACFAQLGHQVTCIDVDNDKIFQLREAKIPIFEPGLEFLVSENIKNKRLSFATALSELTIKPEIIFIAVGTPSEKNGAANMQYIVKSAQQIGRYLDHYSIVIDKSTVPVGMTENIQNIIAEELKNRNSTIEFDIVSNPEFLREGAAIHDFMNPDRIIVGMNSDNPKAKMLELFSPILSSDKIYFMNIKEAEMTKYAANAMLATRISFMNEMAVLCERMGVDIEKVRLGIGSDSRIGPSFIYAGCGYGGSCFPKDINALIQMAEQNGINPYILRAVEKRNKLQKNILSNKIIELYGTDLTNINIGVWGLSFKPETDDIREASSLALLKKLIKHNANIKVYDPVAMPKLRQCLPNKWFQSKKLSFADGQYDVLQQADALILVTEWKAFCNPDLAMMKKLMRSHVILDGRNQYDPQQIKQAEFQYYGIGRG